MLHNHATHAQRAALDRTVPGIGPITAAILVAHLPELGHLNSKALASLAGLAPIIGGCKVAHMGGRPPRQRNAPAFDRLRQRGKPGNVSVVAVMRKILLQLNAVACRGTAWVPQAG